MPTYNPEVIHRYADWLYARAAVVILIYFFLGLGLGYLGLLVLGVRGYGVEVIEGLKYFFFGAGGLLGVAFGLLRSLTLRLRAQLALCLVAIEENTRPED